jgi:hypothetical protein
MSKDPDLTPSEDPTGERADREQLQRAHDAGTRDGGPAMVGSMLAGLANARAAWERRRASVIESSCPNCAIDSAAAKVCTFRGHDFCRHLVELEARGRAKARHANLVKSKALLKPEDFGMVVSGRYNVTAAVAAAKRIAAEEGRLAILAGNAGGGKSLGMAVALSERGGFFVAASDLDPFGKEVNELMAHCSTVGLLGIDDAGAGRSASDVARGRVEQLVCQRWDAGKATIVTTNSTRAEFWALYGGPLGRVADRLNSDPVGWVDCIEESYRTIPQ